ncbi:hypothetical protein [Paraburkholderia terrae]|uniref:hypothetical protein n=1 Tax=Paraburkholderia terrae TaxID=311230 RepID=UPI001E2D8EAF|nr:hypothetical protein [Paraburkholderia terrae]
MMVSWIIIWVFAFGGRRFRGLFVLAVVFAFLAGSFGFAMASGLVFWAFRWHPRFVSVLHASPLCGAAPTFLCRRKEK